MAGHYFDAETAAVAEGFIATLMLTKSTKSGEPEPFTLLPHSRKLIANVLGWRREDGRRLYRKAFFSSGRKQAKALALDTPIPTPTGWTTMGEVQIGDIVFSEDGAETVVTNASEVFYGNECYRVSFSNGEAVIADAGHLWKTSARVNNVGAGRGSRTMVGDWDGVGYRKISTTAELFKSQKFAARRDNNHSVKTPSPIQCDSQKLPIHPYLLGLWLGDGESSGAHISVGTKDVSAVTALIDECGYGSTQRTDKTCFRLYVYSKGADGVRSKSTSPLNFVTVLKASNLHNNKHIPAQYLRASIEQRVALLQGLMDSDGCIQAKQNMILFTTTSGQIRDGFSELLSTLGIKFKQSTHKCACNGIAVDTLAFKFQFFAFRDELPVFRLPRKLEQMRNRAECARSPRCKTVQITDISRVDSVPTRCISVDAPSRMFLFGRTFLPTHNTQTAAAIVLCEFFLNPEPKQEIYMAATDTDQAAICFGAVYDMIVANDDLLALCDITLSQRKIRHRENGSIIRVLSSDGKRKHGYNPSMVVFDELHAWGPAQEELYAALTTGSKSRKQPLRVIVTTAGSDQETICYREYEYAKRILAGEVVDESYLPIIYEVPAEADWTDRNVWTKALPLLATGHHDYADYEEEFNQAMARPDLQNQFRRLYLNQWTSATTQWIPISEWEGCESDVPIDMDELERYPCYGGLDLAAVHDLTAFALCWPVGGKVYYKVWFYLPGEGLEARSKRDGVGYRAWAEDGHIRLTPGTTTDWRYVTAHIVDLAAKYQIKALAFDRYGARDTARELQDAGIEVIDFGQGYQSMSPACRRFEKLIYDRAAVHDGNPVLRWNLDCCQIAQAPGDLIKPVKPERMKNSKRIDGVVAAVMATGIAILTSDQRSIWETRGAPN